MKLFKAIDMSYDRYATTIRNYISEIFTDFGQKFNNSTIFGQIITVMQATVQNIMLYIEDAFVEQNKFTAVRKKSIYGLAQLSGYNPSLGKAAGMQIKLSYIPTTVRNFNVVIRNHTPIICSQNGLQYQIILPQDAIVISADRDDSNKYLYAVEGGFETQRFTSSGGELYLQHVNINGDIDEDYIEVYVNDEKWERVESLYDMDPDGKQWFYKTSIVGGIILGFGNNVHGRSLYNGDSISVTYLKHAGEYGNINTNEYTKFAFINSIQDVTGKDVDGNSLFLMTLASKDHVTSGTFSESQDQVKQMIGYNSRAMVLASPENYKSFLSRFSFCGYNRTWSETGSLVVNSLIMRNYKTQLKDGLDYFKLKEQDFFLTDEQKASIYNCIKNSGRQLVGVTYNIYDPEVCKYALYIYVKLKSSDYDQEYVSNKIRTTIGEFFSNIKNDNYVPKSDIIEVLKRNIPEIDGLNCYYLSEANETAIINKHYINKQYTFNTSTGTYTKTEEKVYLYDGENPNLGLDAHGNILIENPEQYPVLMGGWFYINSTDRSNVNYIDDPLIISYE